MIFLDHGSRTWPESRITDFYFHLLHFTNNKKEASQLHEETPYPLYIAIQLLAESIN